tara:strand:+ start:1617 stop:2981 length:1365 start_codon:yes stop_codon:yes gene_type:complete
LQKTIKNKIQIKGKGLHTGAMVTMILLPAPIDTGINFQRIDLTNEPYIKAIVENINNTNRRTVLEKNGAIVETVEHLLATLFALSIDNLIIKIDGPEIPILDGSAKIFFEKIEKAGIMSQDAIEKSVELLNYFKVENKEDNSSIEFYPHNKLEIEVSIDYHSESLLPQNAKLNKLTDFKEKISSARTFCFLHELNYLINHNLIKGGDVNNGVVFIERDTSIHEVNHLKELLPKNIKTLKKGVLHNKEMLLENEQAKHKLLDLIGDISLIGVKLKGKIIAHKPGHTINTLFAQKIQSEIKKQNNMMKGKPLMNIDDIKKILPHREPFLFIDEIRELENSQVTGIKYVNSNEYYFEGHFPGAPVMPGVLQIEAMAQTGGILALNSVPDPENYLTYFMKIDNVKFKQKVEPNCTLIFKLQLLSPIRRGICHMQGRAYVNNELVTEAELMAKIVKEKE